MSRSVQRWVAVLAAAVGTLLAGGAAGSLAPASAAAPRVAVGAVPTLPAGAALAGALPRSHRVALTLSLASRDPLGLDALAAAVSTPGSPQFRHYLTVGRFAARFGAPASAIATVRATLRRAGLVVAPVDRNHLSLNVSGAAGAVQRAFATRLSRVRLGGGRVAFAQRRTPTLPAAVAADVDAVAGLDTLVRPQSYVQRAGAAARRAGLVGPAARASARPHVATGGPQPCAGLRQLQQGTPGGAAALGGYTADAVADAYGFPGLYAQGDLGAGQTIALYELETLRRADVAAYQQCYGTAVPVSYRTVGTVKRTATDEESALDADQLIGLAPAARIIVYQAQDSGAAGVAEYSRIVSDDSAKTISSSWGACESRITAAGSDRAIVRSEHKLFAEAAIQGQSVVVASGDSGSSGCFIPHVSSPDNRSLAVQDPSSQPDATAVGGTSLFATSDGRPVLWNPDLPDEPAPQQSVWNDGVDKATGAAAATSGGVSALWSMPRYQSRAAAALGVIGAHSGGRPCGARHCRQTPDVSADADPATGYLVYATAPAGKTGTAPQWGVEGGTSAAAPLWAAITAEADALPACRGTTLGLQNPSLYALAAQPGAIADVTAPSPVTGAADNDALGIHKGRFPTTPGYDMTTGLGTPNALAVASGMCGLRAPVYAVAVVGPRVHRAFLHTRVRLHVRGSDSGRLRLTYTATGLPAGLRISRRGLITGRPRRLGRYAVTVTATDAAANAGSVAFPIHVVAPFPTLGRASLTGVARRRPRLSFTVVKGRYAPSLRSVTVWLPRGLSFGRHGRGVRLRAGRHRVRFHYRRRHGAVTLSFRHPVGRVSVTIGRGTLFASRAAARQARRRHHGRLRVRIDATDRHRRTTRLTTRLTARR